jgi:hypothetical protein
MVSFHVVAIRDMGLMLGAVGLVRGRGRLGGVGARDLVQAAQQVPWGRPVIGAAALER